MRRSAATAAPPRPASPTRAVLAEIENGVATLTDISRRTGLDPLLVDAAIQRLVATGHLDSQALRMGCPPSGCTSCSSAAPGGCARAADGRAGQDGPVLVTLTVRTPPS
jgi:hypothetical protein